MLGELAVVVDGDKQGIPFERFEEPDDGLGDAVGILAVHEPFHEQESRYALDDGKDEVLTVLYEIHLEVSELLPAMRSSLWCMDTLSGMCPSPAHMHCFRCLSMCRQFL